MWSCEQRAVADGASSLSLPWVVPQDPSGTGSPVAARQIGGTGSGHQAGEVEIWHCHQSVGPSVGRVSRKEACR